MLLRSFALRESDRRQFLVDSLRSQFLQLQMLEFLIDAVHHECPLAGSHGAWLLYFPRESVDRALEQTSDCLPAQVLLSLSLRDLSSGHLPLWRSSL